MKAVFSVQEDNRAQHSAPSLSLLVPVPLCHPSSFIWHYAGGFLGWGGGFRGWWWVMWVVFIILLQACGPWKRLARKQQLLGTLTRPSNCPPHKEPQLPEHYWLKRQGERTDSLCPCPTITYTHPLTYINLPSLSFFLPLRGAQIAWKTMYTTHQLKCRHHLWGDGWV